MKQAPNVALPQAGAKQPTRQTVRRSVLRAVSMVEILSTSIHAID